MFSIYGNHQPRRNILLKVTLCKYIECWLTHAHPIPLKIYFCTQIYFGIEIYNNTKFITHIQPKDNNLHNHKHIAGTLTIKRQHYKHIAVHKPLRQHCKHIVCTVHVTSKIYHGDALGYPCTFLTSVTREHAA